MDQKKNRIYQKYIKRILDFVLMSYPDREIYQKDIEEELNIRSASVSTLLKKMEAQEFIRREKVSGDDRLKKILPTSHTVEMKVTINPIQQISQTEILRQILRTGR